MTTRSQSLRKIIGLSVGLCSVGALQQVAHAEITRYYNLEGFGPFLDGHPESTAVSEDGSITLPPATHELFSDAAATFSAAVGWGTDIVVARADDGRVMAINADGKEREIYKARDTLVTALTVHAGDLLIAVGPPAKIFRVTRDGKVAQWYAPDAAYIWDMVSGEKDHVYLATGQPATVTRVDNKGSKGVVLFTPEQTHLRSIHYHDRMGVFAGGGERGIVYWSDHDKPFHALFDSEHTEVTDIVTRGGALYISAVSGADAVIAADASESAKSPGPSGGGANAAGGANTTSSKRNVSNADVRSQMIRVGLDGASEVLAGSNDEAIFALAVRADGMILVGTGATGRDDPRGRLYSVDPEKRMIALVYQSPSRRITHLVYAGRKSDKGGKGQQSDVAAVAAAGGRITLFKEGMASRGIFLSPSFDTGISSQFGLLQLFGEIPSGTDATVAVRTGQTADPDATWSDWTSEVAWPQGASHGAAGRYIQLRLTLTAGHSAKRSPSVYRMRVSYLRTNLPPFVRDITTLPKGAALLPIAKEDSKSKTVPLYGKGSDDASNRGGDSASNKMDRARQVERRGAITIKWLADDPNEDQLRYHLMMRSAGVGPWRTVTDANDLEDPFWTMQSNQLPDGYYQFRVIATDRPSNPDGLERQDTRESNAILIDNTAPTVENIKVDVQGHHGAAVLHANVRDQLGPLVQATYAVDSDPPRPLRADDGVLDGPQEQLSAALANLSAGKHTITIYVTDEAENEGFGQATFDVK